MAEEFLESIYEEAKLLCELRQVVEWSKVNDSHHAVMACNVMLQELGNLCTKYLEQDRVKVTRLWNSVQDMTKVNGDLILLGDIVEREVIPRLEDLIKHWGPIETENDEGDFRFETSDSGFLTMKDLTHNRYFHSKVDPMWEARKVAESIFDPKKDSYSILGCGLGYLIYQLYVISNKSIVINVFEKDTRIVEYARNYGVLAWVPEEQLNIVVYTDILEFLHSAEDESAGFYLFPPELCYESEEIRTVLEEMAIQYNTFQRFEKDRRINFWRNIRSDSKLITEFDLAQNNKEFIVIAAGPSLDDNMEFLRVNQGKKTMVAVGTVFKKLIESDITPDMVVVLDPQERTYKQIEGLEEKNIPLLIGMSAYWKFASKYQGDKYLIPIGDSDEVIEFAREHELSLWASGGTVTFLAMQVAEKFGAQQIYLVGVDLAFPNGVTHATGTMDRTTKDLNNLIPIQGVGNQTVYADRVFIFYREQIEKRIAATPEITYYNMSRIGAKIAGTKDGTLIEV